MIKDITKFNLKDAVDEVVLMQNLIAVKNGI